MVGGAMVVLLVLAGPDESDAAVASGTSVWTTSLLNERLESFGFADLQEAAKQPAPDKRWAFEVTPYFWLAGIDADVEARGQKAEIDADFGDIVDFVDLAGSVLATGNYDRWLVWTQLDYFGFGDQDDTTLAQRIKIDIDQTIFTGAAGYELDGPFENSKIGVLGGVRWIYMDAELDTGPQTFDRTNNVVDFLLVLRPDIQLSKRWRFNPTMNVGAGDSELTYELWPQFQFQINDRFAARIGYRRLYYRIDGDVDFDGSLAGFMLGAGLTF